MISSGIDAASARAAKPPRRTLHRQERFWRNATLAPTLLIFALLTILPIINLLVLSLHEVDWAQGESIWTFVGLDHYASLPGDNLLRAGIANTLIFAVVAVSVQMVIGFFLALFTSRILRGRVVYRTIFLLPILIPGIVIGAIWKLMYNFDFGIINQFIGLFGFAARDWLGERGLALASVIVVDIWHWTPFCFLLLLAGLETLPEDIYEAARIDGARPVQELRYLTLPLMIPTIVVTLIFRLMTAFKVFDEVFLLTAGGPGTATEVISFTIYRRFFTEDQAGYGAAMSIAAMFAIALMLVIALALTRNRRAQA